MEHRPPIYSVALCAILSAQLVLSPIFAASAYAAGVTPAPNAPGNKRPSMDVSANGVPLVNITAPNSSGLSHNQYSDFNVRQQGLILNNSSQAVNTQIGGVIAGNPNFYGNSSNEARTILNEVTSANRSRIEGYIEVGGRAADVILANPNGITVNGGGFINVPRATLSTGVPQVNPSGALTGHEVKRGDISIEGAGINADNTDAFSLLARTAYVEAQVRGKNVTVVAGRNNVATDGTVTPLADDPANPKPQIAIDSSALGGMYANRITLVATEKGVGVNLEGTVQSADQMVITADGKLRLREASSGGNAVLASNGDVEVVGGSVTAAKDLTVAADNLRVKKGSLEPQYETRKAARQGMAPPPPAPAATPTSSLLYAGNDMALATANELLNEQSEIRAARKLTISSADGRGTNRVRNSSGTIAAGTDLSITAKSLENFRTILNIRRDTGYYQASHWVNEIKGDGDEVWKDAHTIDKSIDMLDPSTEAGIISADNDIMLVLEAFSNSTGHIAAGRNLSLLATTSAVNASAALYRNTYTKIEYEHWDEDDDYVGRDHRFVYYTDREVVRPFTASITAADTLTITGATLQNTTDRSNTSPLTTRDTAEVAGAVAALSESAMFHTVTTPGHRYRIETNPALTKLGDFYGSDYFLSRIGLDQKKQQVVLLGDAYYETRLVQQQILQSTGQRFLNGYSSDADQMRGLMDAAVNQGKALNLAAGVELTSAQVAALTQDIVWLVEQEVDGQKVYVPRVYLAANSPNSILTGGSLVAANTVNITADSVTNSGSTIRGANSLTMLAGNITNEEGGTLSGKTVQLAAVQDIRNQGAYIAGETLSLTAGRDIISAAKVELAEGSSAKASQSRVARASGISATSTLQATAGRDVTLTGSGLLTGGDASITAGHDITVGSAVTFMERHAKRLDESSTTNHGSAVAVGGNLAMTAGNDLTVAGSTVVAQNNAVLAAARNLSVTATQDTYSFHMRSSKSGGLGKSSSISIDKQSTTSNAANVSAGGNLTLAAGVTGLTAPQLGHASVVGSNLSSGKDLTVAASGNVSVASAQNTSYYSEKKSSTGTLGFSSSAKASGNSSVTQVASTLRGQNISLDAGKSVGIAASNFIAQQNISLTARNGDVSVLDAANQSASWSYKKQTGFGLGSSDTLSSFYGTEGKKQQNAQSTSVGSNLTAGQDITVASSRDASVVGSNLSAGNNVTINAGRDANILGGTNTSSSSKETFTSGFGVEGILGLDKTSFFLGYQQTGKGADREKATNAASQIAAKNTLTVKAGQNVNMSGSKLIASQDLNMAAGKDINILQATETESVSEYEKKLRAGLSLTLSQTATTTVKNAYTAGKQAVSNAEDKNVMGAGEQAYEAYNTAQTITDPKAEASLTVGVSSSWKNSESYVTKAVLSELNAGRDMSLAANRDVSMQGTQAQAGRDMTIAAGRDINITAAQSSGSTSSDSGNIEASAGIAVTASKGGYSLGIKGALALGGDVADGTSHTNKNAKLVAGEKLTTVSGQDTSVAGGNLTGKDVDMHVGRNLNVASVQNSSSFDRSSFNVGAGATVGYGANVDVTQSANLGFGYNTGRSRTVGEQTSILGSNSVNIYTENNTHVAGAIIAALNDNLKLNTGSLSYENIVGKTTETGIKAGIQWSRSFTPEKEGGQGKNEKTGESNGSEQTHKTEQANKPVIDPKETKLYPDAKPWMKSLVEKQKDWKDAWKGFKEDTLHNVSPGAFSYSHRETTQTAYATIGNGEITVRNNPGQSLDGLNRDPNNAMRTETTSKTDLTLKPAFSYVDTALDPNLSTNIINSVHEVATNPSGFFQRIFSGLTGGDKKKDEAKGNGGADSNTPENNNSKAAEQAWRDLRNDPVGFLLNGFREMLSSPSTNKK